MQSIQQVARDGDLTRKGHAALELVQQVADLMSATENRSETMLARAREQLQTMEDRNRAFEERAIQAEARACEAEKWLKLLHDKIEDELAPGRGMPALDSAAA